MKKTIQFSSFGTTIISFFCFIIFTASVTFILLSGGNITSLTAPICMVVSMGIICMFLYRNKICILTVGSKVDEYRQYLQSLQFSETAKDVYTIELLYRFEKMLPIAVVSQFLIHAQLVAHEEMEKRSLENYYLHTLICDENFVNKGEYTVVIRWEKRK